MLVTIQSDWAASFACHEASCAPPPAGTGGSRGGSSSTKGRKTAANVSDALAMMRGGGKVILKSKKQAATLVGVLGKMALDAAAKGEKAPNYDLCKVSVPGTNLFCGASRDIARIHMPQFSGEPVPGSAADKLPKNKKGQVDGTAAFEAHMVKQGVSVTLKTMKASNLKASQNELVGEKIAGMVNNKKFHPEDEAIFVSRDGYIIDGHHRWAAQVARDLKDGHLGDLNLKVRVVDMDIREVLKASNDWAKNFGIMSKAAA